MSAGFAARLAGAGEAPETVAFRLGGELFGCDVRLVEEAVVRRRLHPLPDVPPHVAGVLRLRGELVPVLDLAPRLGAALSDPREAAVLVVDVDDERRIGVAADEVLDVVTLDPGTFRPAPGGERERRVVGVARAGGRLITLIDLAELLREQTTLALRESP